MVPQVGEIKVDSKQIPRKGEGGRGVITNMSSS